MTQKKVTTNSGSDSDGDKSALEMTPEATEFLETVGDDDADTNTDDVDDSGNEDESGTEDKVVSRPPRLKDKSEDEIITEFQNLESEYGRQGNELGEARALLRDYLSTTMNQLSQKKDENKDTDVTEDEIQDDPVTAVNKLVKKAIKPLEESLENTRQSLTISEFERNHPDYRDTVKTPEFQEWVQGSKYRQTMFRRAADYDLEAAGELFSEWEDTLPKPDADDDTDVEPKPTTKLARKQKLRKAKTEAGGAGGSGGTKVKTYKSVDLTRLFIEDREAYNAMMPEIKRALAEGRVR